MASLYECYLHAQAALLKFPIRMLAGELVHQLEFADPELAEFYHSVDMCIQRRGILSTRLAITFGMSTVGWGLMRCGVRFR